MKMPRRKIDASELHDILTKEFRATAGDHCLKCRIPMPAFIEPGERGGANWRIATGDECSNLCHTILEDLAAKLAKSYDIAKP